MISHGVSACDSLIPRCWLLLCSFVSQHSAGESESVETVERGELYFKLNIWAQAPGPEVSRLRQVIGVKSP